MMRLGTRAGEVFIDPLQMTGNRTEWGSMKDETRSFLQSPWILIALAVLLAAVTLTAAWLLR